MDVFLQFSISPVYIFIIITNWDVTCTIFNKKRTRNVYRPEDYKFETGLDRATEECSYVTLNNSLLNKNQTIQEIKNEINNRRVMEFYRQREEEKRRSKEYYENIERESRRRVLLGNLNPGWMLQAQGRPSPSLPPTPFPAPIPMERNLFKRSLGSRGPRRKFHTLSFSYGSFSDHNNCTSRCIFSRMEMVNALGFPQESLISKHLEDRIRNKRIRHFKVRKVVRCFKNLEKVALEDSCIFSKEIFDCMNLGNRADWTGL